MVTTQVPVPLQPPPLQLVNVEPVAGVAVSVTTVPSANVEPVGLLLTVPAPTVVTLSVRITVESVMVIVVIGCDYCARLVECRDGERERTGLGGCPRGDQPDRESNRAGVHPICCT
jgi:hypothetical protein